MRSIDLKPFNFVIFKCGMQIIKILHVIYSSLKYRHVVVKDGGSIPTGAICFFFESISLLPSQYFSRKLLHCVDKPEHASKR